MLSLAGFQDRDRRPAMAPVYEIQVHPPDGSTKTVLAYGTEVITCPVERPHIDVEVNPVVTKLQLAHSLSASSETVEIELLIGAEYYHDFVNTERVPLQDGLLLLDSVFGYILAGRYVGPESKSTNMHVGVGGRIGPAVTTNFDLEKFWRLEEIGIKDSPGLPGDEQATTELNDNIIRNEVEKRYEVTLPKNALIDDLEDNFPLSLGRLVSQIKKSKRHEGICRTMTPT